MEAKYLLQCDNVYDEASRVANKICGLVQGGSRYRDIIVVMCDYENCVQIFKETFMQNDIPVNVDVGGKLIDYAQVKYLRDIMAGAGWEQKVSFKGKTVTQICRELKKLIDIASEIGCKICELLDTCEAILGEQEISLSEFNNMFCTLATAVKVSDVPKYLDRVLIVNVKEYELSFVSHLFVANAVAGIFPSVTADTDIITEQDIANMSINIEPSASQQNGRAFVRARNILDSASNGLYASYSSVNINGERTSVSPILKDFVLDRDETVYSKFYAKTQVLRSIGNESVLLNSETEEHFASLAVACDVDTGRVQSLFVPCDDIQNSEELFFRDGATKVTAIENYIKCPYYHYIINGLKLKKYEPDGFVGPNVVGTIFHAFAEILLKENKKPEEILKDIFKQYKLPKHMERAISKQSMIIAKRLQEEVEQGNFKPKYFEHKLEKAIDGVIVRGVVDRIDIDETSGDFVVIDYKSGGVGDVRLQIPIYMDFFEEAEMPKGGYYLSLKDFTKKEIKPEEIEPAINKLKEVICDLKNGCIIARPLNKKVCSYCPVGAMCERR